MRLPRRLLHPFTVATSCVLVGCKPASNHAVQDSGSVAADTAVVTPRRLASDATLTILHGGGVAASLRAVADSFGRREAVTVVEETATRAELARTLAELGTVPDIIALAEAAFFDPALAPSYTTWHVGFARDRIVIAHRDSAPGAATIDSTTWWKVLERRGVRVGRADPAQDPHGYRPLLVMQLAERHYGERGLAARLATVSSRLTVHSSETAIVDAIRSGGLDYGWVHESIARAARLRYVRLAGEIDLGDPARSATYAAAEVVIPDGSRGDTIRVRGEPIVYGVSIPAAAPSPRYAERFLRFLFSEDGRRILRAADLDVLDTPMVRGSDVPAVVASIVGTGPA